VSPAGTTSNLPHLKDPQHDLVVEFAKAALVGALADPTCNPTTQSRVNEVCDFCWHIAQTMVDRRPRNEEREHLQ
jgi:hypothetical protein